MEAQYNLTSVMHDWATKSAENDEVLSSWIIQLGNNRILYLHGLGHGDESGPKQQTRTVYIGEDMILQMSTGGSCIFCKIISGESPGQILLDDDETVVFKDIKPATKYHYLAVPKEHIININYLTSPEHKALLEKLIENGKRVVEEQGGDVNDIRLGFHCPPFNSISHLHLHVISPASDMGFLSRLVFKPNTWWFQTVDGVLEKLERSKI